MELELWILLRLVVAAILGGLIGYERETTGKWAGFRTHILVAVGSALFVSFYDLLAIDAQMIVPPGPPGNFRVQIEPMAAIVAVVTGISFLGAGTIFVSGRHHRVRGLTTAASIWTTAAVGIATGVGRYILAAGATLLILVVLWLLPRLNLPHVRQEHSQRERQCVEETGAGPLERPGPAALDRT